MTRTFGTASLKDRYWHLQVEPHVAIKLKRVFGRIGEAQHGTIKIASTDEVCADLQWFLQRYPLEVDGAEHLESRAEAFERRTAEYAGVLSGAIEPRAFELALPPRSYQQLAADLVLRCGALILADDLGLGKTVSAITMLTVPETRPALVVTLTHLPIQWEREVHRFAPGLRTHVLQKATPYDIVRHRRRGKRAEDQLDLIEPTFPDVIIANYHKLAGWAETLAPHIRSVVFDECQELRRQDNGKGGKTAKYSAAEHVASHAEFRLALSATPVYNYGNEIYNILNVLRPDVLGTVDEFLREWCIDRRIVEHPKAFGAYLRDQGLMLRRTKADVGRELPELVKVPHHVESDPKALDDVADSAAELARLVLKAGIDGLTKRNAAGQLDWKLRQATGIAKAPYVAAFVRMLVEAGAGKVVLYGWHRDVYSLWLEQLKALRPVMFTGSESAAAKQRSVEAFVEGDAQVLVMSLRSGAGLDGLQAVCSTVVFGELDWSPGVHDQCAGRLHRDGQTDSVVAYYLVSDSGSDPVIADTLGLKQEQIAGVMDPEGEVIGRLQDGSARLVKMAEAYLAQRKTAR